MIHIYTRENRQGKWWCNGTIKGYDHSFEADTPDSVQIEMIRFLDVAKVKFSEVVWHTREYYSRVIPKILIKSQTSRLVK